MTAPAMSSLIYVCPRDRFALRVAPESAFCPSCGSSFPIDNGILLLDSIKRSDRQAFDQSASAVTALTAEQKADGQKRIDRLLQHGGVQKLQGAAVLDVGCGLGDLSYGLASSPHLQDCDIYAVDHSVDSLRVLQRSIDPLKEDPLKANRIRISAQDASALCFPDGSFDLIVGSAVLHHILDYSAFLASIFAVLKVGGIAIFTEPFLDGYLLPILFLSIAVDQLGLTSKDLQRPEFGMCRYLIDDTSFRVQHADDLKALDALVDKHYFKDDRAAMLGYSLGFRKVSFRNYEQPNFYDNFMSHLLMVYGITDKKLTRAACRYYDLLRRMAGDNLSQVVAHFKYMIFEK